MSTPESPFPPRPVANGHPPSLTPGNIPAPYPNNDASPSTPAPFNRELLPHGRRSLSGISLRAFTLGLTLGLTLPLTTYLLYHSSPFWRAPFFLLLLSLFHFLEFYTTAYANTPKAVVSSFLLSNGSAYRIAHSAALFECVITSSLVPGWQAYIARGWVVGVGLVMVAVGQAVRSWAMVYAGTNFNHVMQRKRSAGHVLVTDGVYRISRHPAYFGFFWWGVGSQIVLGNGVCCVAYAVVLWNFFFRRIRSEEQYLTQFFPEEYPKYKTTTPVLIPFIR